MLNNLSSWKINDTGWKIIIYKKKWIAPEIATYANLNDDFFFLILKKCV